MISTSPLTDTNTSTSGITRHHTMTYDPYLGTNNASENNRNSVAKVPEFLRPLPKPARYTASNGDSCTPLLATSFQTPIRINGIRPPVPQTKYLPPRPVLEEAVNLVHKREYNGQEEYTQRFINTTSSQQYTPPSHYYTPSAPIVSHQYTPLYFNTRAQNPSNNNQAYIHIPNSTTLSATYSSPPKPGQSVLKDVIKPQSNHQLQLHLQQKVPFKVPSGKEGSLKHRILTRPVNESPNKKKNGPLHPSGAHFARGSLIQLATGELRKIEEMRTEDFISAAEKCPALRLDPSTVVRITENSQKPQEVLITLNYGRQGTQSVELEVSLEHPFFVYGKGWASISPERSLHNFDLPCHRLSVGDICISLSPRPTTNNGIPQGSAPGTGKLSDAAKNQIQATAAAAAAAELLRKRRWSAPDQFCSDDENDGPSPSQRTKDASAF